MAVQKRYRNDLSGAIRAGVESALSNQHTTVPGTIVDFDAKTATAIFDAVKTDAAEIGAASANAGYPATPIS